MAVSDMAEHRINWSRNELILACAVLAANDWRLIRREDDRVTDLSSLLRDLTHLM